MMMLTRSLVAGSGERMPDADEWRRRFDGVHAVSLETAIATTPFDNGCADRVLDAAERIQERAYGYQLAIEASGPLGRGSEPDVQNLASEILISDNLGEWLTLDDIDRPRLARAGLPAPEELGLSCPRILAALNLARAIACPARQRAEEMQKIPDDIYWRNVPVMPPCTHYGRARNRRVAHA